MLKRHGARIIYIDFKKYERLYCLMAYPKGVKEDLSDADKKEIREFVKYLREELEVKYGKE